MLNKNPLDNENHMKTLPTQERALRKRSALIAAAIEEFSNAGFEMATAKSIAALAGVATGTFYQYFENKKDLVGNVVKNFIEEDEKVITSIVENADTAIEGIHKIAKHVLQMLRKMSPSMIFDTKKYFPEIWDSLEKGHFNFIRQTIAANILRGQEEGLYIKEIDHDIISRLYISLTFALADEKLFPLTQYTRSDLFSNLINYHLRSLLTDRGREIYKSHIIKNKT